MSPTVGSLFAGIGGFDLGFERAGFRTAWQVEINEFCRRVLAKHWPDARRHDDVKTFPPTDPEEWRVDVIIGGFPCQDISVAGKGEGIDGERSGLWGEYARIVRVVRPRYVVVENSPALLARGLHRVLGDLAACGYDAEWDCIPAAAAGAPHLRDRLYLVAYPHGGRLPGGAAGGSEAHGHLRVGDERARLLQAAAVAGGGAGDGANPDGERREEQHVPALAARAGRPDRAPDAGRARSDAPGHGRREDDRHVYPASGGRSASGLLAGTDAAAGRFWGAEPDVGRVAHGVPARVDRLSGLGNAVVPQVAEWIGRRVMAFGWPDGAAA